MASNFRIVVNNGTRDLFLELNGDFDGSSAHELLNVLADISATGRKAYIDTSGLDTIHPFGIDVFQRNLTSTIKPADDIYFQRKNAFRIMGAKEADGLGPGH